MIDEVVSVFLKKQHKYAQVVQVEYHAILYGG